MRGRLFVSPHARDRYRERVDASLSGEQAIDAILSDIAAGTGAHRRGRMLEITGARPRRIRYRVGPPKVVGGAPVVVTVLAR